ncbi:MAG: diacylglycerol kinase family protein [Sphingomicrobium sp.]
MADRSKPVPIIINQGGGSAGDDARERVCAAITKAGVNARIILAHGPDCAERALQLVKDGAAIVVAAGGDGTMSAVAGALAGTKTAMGVIPLGTLNHLARDLGIPLDLEEAAVMLAAGTKRKIDVAELNGRVFVNNSAIGLYPLMVMDREAQQKRLGRSKKLAMLVAALRTLVRFRHQRLSLTVNDQEKRIETPLLFVGNNDYRTDIGAAGTRESIADGHLCVMVMRHSNRRGLIAAAIRALLGRTKNDDMIRLEGVERLRVDARRQSLTVSLDGEVLSQSTPLDYRIRKHALTVIAPAASKS